MRWRSKQHFPPGVVGIVRKTVVAATLERDVDISTAISALVVDSILLNFVNALTRLVYLRNLTCLIHLCNLTLQLANEMFRIHEERFLRWIMQCSTDWAIVSVPTWVIFIRAQVTRSDSSNRTV